MCLLDLCGLASASGEDSVQSKIQCGGEGGGGRRRTSIISINLINPMKLKNLLNCNPLASETQFNKLNSFIELNKLNALD